MSSKLIVLDVINQFAYDLGYDQTFEFFMNVLERPAVWDSIYGAFPPELGIVCYQIEDQIWSMANWE